MPDAVCNVLWTSMSRPEHAAAVTPIKWLVNNGGVRIPLQTARLSLVHDVGRLDPASSLEQMVVYCLHGHFYRESYLWLDSRLIDTKLL